MAVGALRQQAENRRRGAWRRRRAVAGDEDMRGWQGLGRAPQRRRRTGLLEEGMLLGKAGISGLNSKIIVCPVAQHGFQSSTCGGCGGSTAAGLLPWDGGTGGLRPG